MKIVHFGNYNPEYNRTSVIEKGLRQNGAEVLPCNDKTSGALLYLNLWKKLRTLDYDAILIGSTDSRSLVPFTKLISRKPVVFDMLYALYDNWIEERELASKTGIKAWYYKFIDWLACQVADAVIVENDAHADYFAKTYHARREKFIRVLVGTDETQMFPLPRGRKDGKFVVEFHGKFFPMQGTDTIVRAAQLLLGKGVEFVVIGGGQEYAKTKKLAEDLQVNNVQFLSWVPFAELPKYVADGDVSLGLIGDYPRTYRSMPNKLYETAAMARLCINADTPAVREIFTDGKDVALVPAGNPEALAEKILWLKEHISERDRMEKGAYATFLARATPGKIGEALRAEFSNRFGLA